MVLVWGVKRVVPVLVSSLTITEEAFDPRLQPIRVKASIECKVLTSSDLPLQHLGGTPVHRLPAGRRAARHDGHQLGPAPARTGAPAVSVSRYANVGQADLDRTRRHARSRTCCGGCCRPPARWPACACTRSGRASASTRSPTRAGRRRAVVAAGRRQPGDAPDRARHSPAASSSIPLPAGVPGAARVASELTLSLMMGDVGVDPVPRAVMEALTEVSVQDRVGRRPAERFRAQVRHQQGLADHDPAAAVGVLRPAAPRRHRGDAARRRRPS